MNYNDLLFYDFETTGKDPNTCQPIQLAAVMIDARKLKIYENSLFQSYIRPIFDTEECYKLGLEPLSDRILEITGITLEELENAPSLKTVWEQFQEYVNKYNKKKSKWGAPIRAGMNIDKYDNIIVERICGGNLRKTRNQLDTLTEKAIISPEVSKIVRKNDPYGFGPWDEERQESTLFFPRDSVDLLRILWMWTENNPRIKSLSMDAIREWLGISTEGAHKADKDVYDGAEVLMRFLKLHRTVAPKTKFKNSMAKNTGE